MGGLFDFSQPPQSIAIELKFNGPQPNHFGAKLASAVPMKAGEFIGDTRLGGSCNAQDIAFNPHCNGTHTESISHVINELIPPHEAVKNPLMSALVVSIKPQAWSDLEGGENSYQPPPNATDLGISKNMLTAVSHGLHKNIKALIIRTLPNPESKLEQVYGGPNQPAFFTHEAMQWLVSATAVEHLLVDMPSVDRLNDDGRLSNHRIFWNIEPGVHQWSEGQFKHKTITEMVYVPSHIQDGEYGLCLQLPRMNLNAVPSHPVLFPTLKPTI